MSLPDRLQNAEFVINFSGGKDSCAMLAYICAVYPQAKKHVVFADTGWEHDGAQAWCQGIVGKFGLTLNVVKSSTKDFFSMVRGRGKFPSPAIRQCTSDLKVAPIEKWIRNNCGPLVVNCLGLRAEESPGRAKKPTLALNSRLSNSKREVWDYLPIHDWSQEWVRGYLSSKAIPLHPVYRYLKRFSCQLCIYASKADIKAIAKHNPTAVERIAALEQEIGFTMRPDGPITQALAA